MKNKERIVAIAILILAGVSYRVIPHPANFAPVAAISLFSGFFFRRNFFLIPISIMLASDLFIGFYDWKLMSAVYLSFILAGLLGALLRKNKSILTLVACSLSGSVLFFILTNLAVWFFSPWYAHNFSGLLKCYEMAVPFFKNTLAGDLFYTSIIFGCYEVLAQPKEVLAFFLAKPELIREKV